VVRYRHYERESYTLQPGCGGFLEKENCKERTDSEGCGCGGFLEIENRKEVGTAHEEGRSTLRPYEENLARAVRPIRRR
jgi:hypothetical protein